MAGEKLELLARALACVVVGISMMFALGSWQMSLVMLGAVPILAATSAVKKRAIEGKRRVDGEADGGSAKAKESLVRAGAIVVSEEAFEPSRAHGALCSCYPCC